MKKHLYHIQIETEMDVVLAHQKTIRLCTLAGLTGLGQTHMGTAVSEIARNTLEYAKPGRIDFYVVPATDDVPKVEIVVADTGQGFDLNALAVKSEKQFSMKGNGISMSRKLVDHFEVNTSSQGTVVIMQKKIPRQPLHDKLLSQWKNDLSTLGKTAQSPYEELKLKNQELVNLTQQLEEKDVANRQQLDEIKTLNDELDRKNQELTEFAYTLSHDLKNPLSNIMALIPLARSAEEKKLFLDKIEISAMSLENIIRGLMQIIDVDQDVSTQIRALSFQQIVDHLSAEYDREIVDGGAKIHTDFQVETISYVEPYLNSILRNLISNAVKYQAKDRALVLALATRHQHGYVLLSVEDNGIGMNLSAHQHVLFKPFRRLTEYQTGKGIGLHIIKKMIEKNGGKIEVDSSVGEGTTFRCYLKAY